MMRALMMVVVVVVLSACEGGLRGSFGQGAPAVDGETGDGLRYPGEILVPRDMYKEAYQRALKNITPDNLEERLSMLEGEIASGDQ